MPPRYGSFILDRAAILANVYNFLGEASRAKVAAKRALEIDERLPDAHAALANASLFMTTIGRPRKTISGARSS